MSPAHTKVGTPQVVLQPSVLPILNDQNQAVVVFQVKGIVF
jgi:hypothetical protein